MNSALQCLSHCQDLTKFFLLKYHTNDINKNSTYGSYGQIANSYYELIHNLWTSESEYLCPIEFRHMLINIVKKFQGFSQQDSHELLTYLLDSLHEDLNRNITKPYIEMIEKEDSESDIQASKRWWENHLKRENSIIVDLFHGQYRSTIKCPECNKISITYDPFMYLGLPIPVNPEDYISIKYFPNILKNFQYKFFNLNVPYSYFKKFNGKELKLLTHTKFGLRDINNKYIIEKSKCLKNYEIIILTSDKLFKEIMNDEDEILPILEKEGEIIIFEKYIDKLQFENEENVFSFYLNPIMFNEENSRIFFNKTTRTVLYYPLLISITNNLFIKDLYFLIFKIYRKILKINISEFLNIENNLNNNIDEVLRKEFEQFYNENNSEEFIRKIKEIPFELYFLNTIPESEGFFTNKQECEFCLEKNCNYCKINFSLEFKNTIYSIFNKLKIKRRICFLVKLNGFQGKSFCNKNKFPFNLEELSKKPLITLSANVKLEDCLNLFRKDEILDKENSWFCGKCKKHQEASKKMEIYKAPNILIIQLKRFKIKTNNAILGMIQNGKNESNIEYPLEGFDISKYIVGEEKTNIIYDLFGISHHFGNLSFGHYTAVCKNEDKWYYFDDESVVLTEEKNVVKNSAYLLFYRKRVEN